MTRHADTANITRRALAGGLLASGLAGPALGAELPRDLSRHAGYRAWSRMAWPHPVPLNEAVLLPGGRETSLRQWLGTGPVVLVLWAHWCTPCIAEKPAQSFLSRRLVTSRSPTRIKMLQAFDDLDPAAAPAALERIGARGLDIARASLGAEREFVRLFGASVSDPRRTAMPSELLLAPDGTELGRGKGSMISATGHSYWSDVQTFQFLIALGQRMGAA